MKRRKSFIASSAFLSVWLMALWSGGLTWKGFSLIGQNADRETPSWTPCSVEWVTYSSDINVPIPQAHWSISAPGSLLSSQLPCHSDLGICSIDSWILLFLLFLKKFNQPGFRVVSNLQKNWAENTENSHTPPQPPPFPQFSSVISLWHQCGIFVNNWWARMDTLLKFTLHVEHSVGFVGSALTSGSIRTEL